MPINPYHWLIKSFITVVKMITPRKVFVIVTVISVIVFIIHFNLFLNEITNSKMKLESFESVMQTLRSSNETVDLAIVGETTTQTDSFETAKTSWLGENSNKDDFKVLGAEKQSESAMFDETVLLSKTLNVLRFKLNCLDRTFKKTVIQRGEFWVINNYILADHGPLACHEHVTITTHSDYSFIEELIPLIKRWNNPVSIALNTPGEDLSSTVVAIAYMRICSSAADLIRKWVSFHLYFHRDHMPERIPTPEEIALEFDCSSFQPGSTNTSDMYKTKNGLLYPINVGRNVAKEAALTHYIFAVDIELYPSPNLPERFLNMIARDSPLIQGNNSKVFPLVPFEVKADQQVPMNKTHLLQMLKENTAQPFHKKLCSSCHTVPQSKEWMATDDTGQLDVFAVGKRSWKRTNWEPFYIGTQEEPMYDERFTWEGRSNKMPQGYILCAMDYDFMILNNAFLVHHPGISKSSKKRNKSKEIGKTSKIKKIVTEELKIMYGDVKGCRI